MRRIILAATTVALVSVVYLVARGNASEHDGTKPATVATQGNIKADLSSALRSFPQTAPCKDDDEVNSKLAELESRLQHIENLRAGDEEPTPPPETDPRPVPKISETNLAQWMDESLSSDARDDVWANQARAELGASISHLPGATVERVQCGMRFCRATLAQADGERPMIQKLLGAAPFVNETMTINEPEGRIAVYFTRTGQSVNGLRREAMAASQH